jgi:hypothetical protein
MAKRKKRKTVLAEQNRDKDLLKCPGESYFIERSVCEARRRRGFKYCRRCPENSDLLNLFESPLQVKEKKQRKRRKQ